MTIGDYFGHNFAVSSPLWRWSRSTIQRSGWKISSSTCFFHTPSASQLFETWKAPKLFFCQGNLEAELLSSKVFIWTLHFCSPFSIKYERCCWDRRGFRNWNLRTSCYQLRTSVLSAKYCLEDLQWVNMDDTDSNVLLQPRTSAEWRCLRSFVVLLIVLPLVADLVLRRGTCANSYHTA